MPHQKLHSVLLVHFLIVRMVLVVVGLILLVRVVLVVVGLYC